MSLSANKGIHIFNYAILLFLLLFFLAPSSWAQASNNYQIDAPFVALNGRNPGITVKNAEGIIDKEDSSKYVIKSEGKTYTVKYAEGKLVFSDIEIPNSDSSPLELVSNGTIIHSAEPRSIPCWLSVLPPLIAIGLAFIFKRVLPALFLGVWVGARIAAALSLYGRWT